MCKQRQTFLLAGLAVMACGMTALPAMAQTASITFLNEFNSTEYYSFTLSGMSDDGSAVVGRVDRVIDSLRPYRWAADTGIVVIPPPPGVTPRGTAEDVSADGSKVIGHFDGLSAFYWTAAEGTVGVGDLPGGVYYSAYSAGWGVSADGSTIVGASESSSGYEAYRRTLDGSIFGLGDIPDGPFESQAFDVSADGGVIVGVGRADFYGTATGIKRAVRWTAANGYNLEVPDFVSAGLYDLESYAWGVSNDGTTAVGEITTIDGTEAFRWTADGGVELPFRSAGSHASVAKIVSPDGSLISSTPGIWMEATNSIVSLADIQDMLVNDFGVDMGGWDITTTGSRIEAMSVTPQGITLLGMIPFDRYTSSTYGLPYIIHLPYLPVGTAPEPICSATWESDAIGWTGLSMQPPWEAYDATVSEQVWDLEVFDDGNGPMLYAAGLFQYAGGNFIGNGVAKWDGQAWSALGIGLGGPGNPTANVLRVLDDGTGPALYVAGGFDIAGGVFANDVAKWDGQTWSAMGSGLTSVRDFLVFDDGTGPAIYATGILRTIYGAPFDDGIAKWTGSQWVQLGSGLANSTSYVSAEAVVFDDGTGPALYVGGGFDTAGGLPVGSTDIAKWDGQNWSVVPLQLGAVSLEMAWDDGTGPALYFTRGYSAQGPSQFVKWDGQTWTDAFVGSEPFVGPDASVFKALTGEMDDGNGPAMFATTASPPELYRWDGQDWVRVRPFGSGGVGGIIRAVAQFDDGVGNGIYMVGGWIQAGDEITRNIALLRACTIPHPGDCDADRDVDMTDLDFFSSCLSGPDGGLGVGCECADVDGDGDVDLSDFQSVMASFTG